MTYKRVPEGADACSTLARRARVRRHRKITGPVPLPFEEFYRGNLRFVVGLRMRRLEIAKLYDAWAGAHGKPSLNLRQIKAAMRMIGHPMIESNGMYYGDVGLAQSFPDLPDNYPALPLPTVLPVATICERIDAALSELVALRAEIQRAESASSFRSTSDR